MRRLRLFLCFFFFSFSLFAQDRNYAEINFIGYISDGSTGSRKLYVNDHLITTFSNNDIVKLKIYSKGRLTVTYLTAYARIEGVIEIKENKDYYYAGGNPESIKKVRISNQSIEKDVFNNLKNYLEEKKEFTYNVIDEEEEKSNPIGKIVTSPEDIGPKQGTCFLISKQGYLLTNYHVISGAKTVQIKGIGNDFSTLYAADVVGFDVDLDMALLKLKNQNLVFEEIPFKLSSETTPQGTGSFVLGYPITNAMGEEIKVTEGLISSKSGYKGTISQYQFSASIQPGNSGSPLFNSNGDIIGIINAKLFGAEGAGYAIKSQYINTFLSLLDKIQIENNKTTISNLSLTDKILKLKNYIFIVKSE